MAKKLSITVIAATVAASLAITSAAEAGGRGVALGVGLGVLAVGAMAHQAQKAKQAQMARARAQAQAQARAKAQAQARAKAQAQAAAAKRQQQAAAAAKAKAQAAKADQEDNAEEVAEETTKSGPSTYVAAPSSSAALTQADINAANAETAKGASTVTVAGTPAATEEIADETPASNTCKRFVPALGVPVDVDC